MDDNVKRGSVFIYDCCYSTISIYHENIVQYQISKDTSFTWFSENIAHYASDRALLSSPFDYISAYQITGQGLSSNACVSEGKCAPRGQRPALIHYKSDIFTCVEMQYFIQRNTFRIMLS